MSFPVQNPDPAEALVDLYDIKARIQMAVDRIIQPVAIVDDGWKRVTYSALETIVAASQASAELEIVAPDPLAVFQLMGIQYSASGGYTGSVQLRMVPTAAFSSGWTQLQWAVNTFTGSPDPEVFTHQQIVTLPRLVSPLSTGWAIRFSTTGVGEAITVKSLFARIPRSIRPL